MIYPKERLTYNKHDTNLDIVHELREFFEAHITDIQIEDLENFIYDMRNKK